MRKNRHATKILTIAMIQSMSLTKIANAIGPSTPPRLGYSVTSEHWRKRLLKKRLSGVLLCRSTVRTSTNASPTELIRHQSNLGNKVSNRWRLQVVEINSSLALFKKLSVLFFLGGLVF